MYTMLGTQKARTHPVELAIGINIRNYFITSSPESPSNLASLRPCPSIYPQIHISVRGSRVVTFISDNFDL